MNDLKVTWVCVQGTDGRTRPEMCWTLDTTTTRLEQLLSA